MFSFLLKFKPVGIQRQNTLASLVAVWYKGTGFRFITYGLCLWGLWVSIPTSFKNDSRIFVLSRIVDLVHYPYMLFEDVKSYFYTYQSLLKEHDALKNENQKLKIRIFEQNMQISDMIAFKNVLDEIDYTDKKTYPARVLGSVFSFPHATLFVQSQKPVESSRVAIHPQGLVGRVLDGKDKTFVRILLLTDCQSRIPVRLQKTGEQAILAGQGTDDLKVMYLERNKVGNKTQDAELEEGDLFVTSGIDDICPPNIPVAEVIYDKNGDLYARPLVNIKKMRFITLE